MNKDPHRRAILPRTHMLTELHSRVHLCREAALVRLSDGVERIACAKHRSEEYHLLCFDGKPLITADIPHCGTCRSLLRAGYGDGIMSDAACRAAGDRLSAGYWGLADAIDAVAPVLGLFASGLYVVADFELSPVFRSYSAKPGLFFWEFPSYDEVLQQTHDDRYFTYHDAPIYLSPTQRTSDIDLAQVEAYRARMDEGEAFPRAVAFYMGGSVALLLDGHHKAIAAAAEGRMVKCLVIFPAEDSKALRQAITEGRRLYLRHGKNIQRPGGMHIADGQEERLARVGSIEEVGHHDLDVTPLPFPAPAWGTLPEEYSAKCGQFPVHDLLYRATLIPPDRIQETYQRLRESLIFRQFQDDRFAYQWAYEALISLQACVQFFPEKASLTDKQRAWLFAESTRERLRSW